MKLFRYFLLTFFIHTLGMMMCRSPGVFKRDALHEFMSTQCDNLCDSNETANVLKRFSLGDSNCQTGILINLYFVSN